MATELEEMAGMIDIEDAMSRFRSQDRIVRYLSMFLKDESYKNLKEFLEQKNYAEAFRAAHTLKGVCLNLSLSRLKQSASELTEALRGGEPKGDVDGLFETVQNDYETTVTAIRKLTANKG